MNEATLFRCLAAPTRLRVLRCLEQGETCVSDLAADAQVEQTNLSHQLRDLRTCGLVLSRQDGKRVYYRLAHPRLGELLRLGDELARHVETSEECAEACC